MNRRCRCVLPVHCFPIILRLTPSLAPLPLSLIKQRRVSGLTHEVALARAALRSAELGAVEAEAHARSRILYLELWKAGAEARLIRFAALADDWVPAAPARAATEEAALRRAQAAELAVEVSSLRVQLVELRCVPPPIPRL